MLIYQSKANLDGKTLLGKITHHLDPEIRKMLVRGMFGARIPQSTLVHNSPVIEVEILFLKLAM